MNNEDSLASLGINLPEPLKYHTVKSGRKYLQFKNSPIALSVQYSLFGKDHPVTMLCLRVIQIGTPEDEIVLSGNNIIYDQMDKIFRKPKQFYVVFEHPASPKEVLEALREEAFFSILSNNLSAVYGIETSPKVLEDSLCTLDPYFAKYCSESTKAPKQALKL